MSGLADDHPIFNNILKVSDNCYIAIRQLNRRLLFKYVSPSDPRVFKIGVETHLGYMANLKTADHLLRIWSIYGPLELTGPELPLVYKKIKQMEERQKKRMEVKHKTNKQVIEDVFF